MRLRCPHCHTLSTVRTSETLSDTVTWMYLQCNDINCGHTWRVDAAASVTISPSARPNPRVNLPMSQHVARQGLREALDRSPSANIDPVGAHTLPLFGGTSPQPTG